MSDNDRYLWLGLEAGLWPSYVLEHRLANALADAGRQVTMIECQGALKAQCPVMTANHIPVNASMKSRGPICSDCRHNASLVQARSRYSSLDLDAYITDEIRSDVTEIMAEVTVANWGDLVVDGIPVGRYATYLTMLHHKLPDVASSDEAWAEYLADLRNSLLVLKALPALFAANEPTHAVVYNPLYPTHRVFVEFARARGIRIVSVSAGSYLPARYETAFVFPESRAARRWWIHQRYEDHSRFHAPIWKFQQSQGISRNSSTERIPGSIPPSRAGSRQKRCARIWVCDPIHWS